jgi:hypothetical protein
LKCRYSSGLRELFGASIYLHMAASAEEGQVLPPVVLRIPVLVVTVSSGNSLAVLTSSEHGIQTAG